jgi:hypothetical protein
MSLHDCPHGLKLWQAYLEAATKCADLKLKQQLAATDATLYPVKS